MSKNYSKKELLRVTHPRRFSFREVESFKYKFELKRKKFINTKLLEEIAGAFNSIIKNEKINKTVDDDNVIFYLRKIPKVSIYDYLLKIEKFTKIEPDSLICALVYIDKLCNKKNMNITKYNAHLLLSTAILIAGRQRKENFCSNYIYSKLAGIPIKRLALQEQTFKELIDYDFKVHENVFRTYSKNFDFYYTAF